MALLPVLYYNHNLLHFIYTHHIHGCKSVLNYYVL